MLFQRECNESLLVNFGIEPRSDSKIFEFNEQKACLDSIQQLQILLSYEQSNRDEVGMHQARIIDYLKKRDQYSSFLTNDQVLSEYGLNERKKMLRRDSIYFGCQNGAGIYCLLLSVADEFKGKLFYIYTGIKNYIY